MRRALPGLSVEMGGMVQRRPKEGRSACPENGLPEGRTHTRHARPHFSLRALDNQLPPWPPTPKSTSHRKQEGV